MTATAGTFETVVLPWFSPAPPTAARMYQPDVDVLVEGMADSTEPRITRFVALCALLAWLGVGFIVATVAQVIGVWVWVPTGDAVVAFVCFAAAAMTATLWLPSDAS